MNLLLLAPLLLLFVGLLLLEANKGLFRRFGTTGKPQDLSKRAFALWEQAGHPEGREWEFWNLAVTELSAQSKAPEAPGKKEP